MFDFAKKAAPPTKCAFTHCSLPSFVDQNQPPSKRKPFSIFASQHFNQTIHLTLPEELYMLIEQRLRDDENVQHYSLVYISLGDIVDSDFLNKHVKNGNVMMLSEGRPTVDNCFSLRDGVLRLELDQPTYERDEILIMAVIELNLRLPSMRHGKKGFGRIEWAFKNVLNHSLSWLFCDLDEPARPLEGITEPPITKYHPISKTLEPKVQYIKDARVPVFIPPQGFDDHEYVAELLEWVGLAKLASPRIREDDSIDAYLSRYAVPIARDMKGNEMEPVTRNLVNVTWCGFASPLFVEKLFMNVRRVAGEEWLALSVSGFQDEGYSVVNSGQDVLAWEWPAANR
ncbi:MAG: hypothetical protein M1821_003428 [Bathelium mastoideum]|nr:MAG: hypothetical protein M1821_003428 [Bathelium mastoideum]KAI9686014.1 MAG: hypothetical protein M1822_003997 [Bathelium mastoideum]